MGAEKNGFEKFSVNCGVERFRGIDDEKKHRLSSLECLEMWSWKRMNIKWMDMMINDELLRRAEEKNSFMRATAKRKVSWVNRILRRDRL